MGEIMIVFALVILIGAAIMQAFRSSELETDMDEYTNFVDQKIQDNVDRLTKLETKMETLENDTRTKNVTTKSKTDKKTKKQ